ncbi:hypothetical protein [Streptomyces sp. MS2.AVA.5]|uniref:Uncharacterized protein n=1 Tax=Streptomyces achmelvichensis TaxID=3134111 RepID=A0ACC6PKD8_9ACTN
MDESAVTPQESAEARRQQPDHGAAAAAASHGCGCGGCGGSRVEADAATQKMMPLPPFVYAVGRIEPRFPNLGVEKEFAQATGRAETANMSDGQALHAVLSEPQNRYLSKQLCYVLMIRGIDTYFVQPRDTADFDLLVDALGATPRMTDLHVVIGLLSPFAPSDRCNGLMLPVAAFDQIYAFDTETLVTGLPKPDRVDEEPFRTAAADLFERVVQLADNTGSTDTHRALNYLAVRYTEIYAKSAESSVAGLSLTAIETRPSRLGGSRNIQDVLFSYTDRKTDVTEKYFVRVDVTEEFPFLVTKLSPYYDR